MKKIHVAAAVVFVLFAWTSVLAGGATPAYDITGIWRSQDPGTAQQFQSGADVRMIYVNRGFSHYFEGTYVTPTQIKGTQYRRNRSNGCLTAMAVTINVLSADSYSGEWEAMDGNCDLQKGRKGSWKSERDKKLEQSAWY
jgi:hypothetical protein